MVERSSIFVGVAERLGDLLVALESGERRLKEQSEALASLLLKASGSLPQVEKRIEDLSIQMANAVRENQHIVGAAMTDSATAFQSAVLTLRQDLTGASSGLSASIVENQKLVNGALAHNALAIRTSSEEAGHAIEITSATFGRHLTDLVVRSGEQVDVLAANLSDMVKQNQQTVGKAVSDNAAAIRTSAQDAGKAIELTSSEFSRQMTDLVGQSEQHIEALAVQLRDMVMQNQQTVGKALTENAGAIRESVEAARKDMTATNADFNRQVTELAAKTKEQVATLDAALATELQKSLQSLAHQFTAISGRFAQDYGPLADKLKQIVEFVRVAT